MTSREQPETPTLQPPGEWTKRPLGGWLVSVVTAGLAVFLAAPAVTFTLQGDVRGAVTFGVLVAALLAGAVLGRPKRHLAPAATVSIDIDGVRTEATRFAVRPSSRLVSVLLMLAGAAFAALGVAAAVLSVRDGEAAPIIGFFLLGGIGSLFLLGGFAGLRASRTGLGIDLTPRHVVVGLGFDRLILTWEDIARVDATSLRYTARLMFPAQVQHWLLIAGASSSKVVSQRRNHPRMLGRAVGRVTGDVVAAVPTERLGSDPVVVFHALRHYLDHPDQRADTANGAAVVRWSAYAGAC